MAGTDTDEPDAGPAEAPDSDSDGAGDQPDLDEQDYVDVPEDLAEEVTTDDQPDDQAEGADGTDDPEQDDQGDEGDSNPLTSGTSVGTIYCNGLGLMATLARERKGSGVDDREQTVDEYAELAQQIEIDQFVDEWVEAHGGPDQLTPGQGIVVGTSMFAMMVLMDDPEMAGELDVFGGDS